MAPAFSIMHLALTCNLGLHLGFPYPCDVPFTHANYIPSHKGVCWNCDPTQYRAMDIWMVSLAMWLRIQHLITTCTMDNYPSSRKWNVGNFWWPGDTYVVVGRPNNLVFNKMFFSSILGVYLIVCMIQYQALIKMANKTSQITGYWSSK
jgi:hypothetical protein